MRRVMNVIRPDVSVAAIASGNSRSVKRARSALRLRSRSQSAMKDAEIDLAQLGFDRRRLEKMQLDEFAEFVGDAMLVALDDRGVRDRQSQRPAKQRHHRVPVGQAADGGGLRKCRDEAEAGCTGSSILATTNSASVPASTSVASALTRRNSAARAASPGASNENCAVRVMTSFRTRC